MYSDLDQVIKSQLEIIHLIQSKLIRTDAAIDINDGVLTDDNHRLQVAVKTLQRLIMCKNG